MRLTTDQKYLLGSLKNLVDSFPRGASQEAPWLLSGETKTKYIRELEKLQHKGLVVRDFTDPYETRWKITDRGDKIDI